MTNGTATAAGPLRTASPTRKADRTSTAADRPVFVFGSNLAGRHGKGAANYALRHHGAIYGRGIGLQGNSYAIPTKDANLKTLSLIYIREHVSDFIKFAKAHPEMTFQVTAIGTGLAGYDHADIAPLFKLAPTNCTMPVEWLDILHRLRS